MIDLELDSTHDLAMSRGDIGMVGGRASVAQRVQVALMTFFGEWFLDVNRGVPYFDHILIKGQYRPRLEAIFRSSILAVPGVKSIASLGMEIDTATRTLRVVVSIIDDNDNTVPINFNQTYIRRV